MGLLLFSMASMISFANLAHSYMINVDAGVVNECFHERVPVGTKLGLSYEVIDGGFYDIDVEIRDPTNLVVHSEERSSNGKVTIEANQDGNYNFCFSNRKSSQSPKLIIFDIDRSDVLSKSTQAPSGAEGDKKDDETNKLAGMVETLLLATISSRHDVRYLTARDRVHRQISESTNSTIIWWSGVEFILLLGVTLGQVYYLKRFFEVRRKA